VLDERLARARQVDGARAVVDVHEEEDDARLQVALDVVDDDLLALQRASDWQDRQTARHAPH
jgi:hypothetical protein